MSSVIIGILGGSIRVIDGAIEAAPTLLVGLLIASVLRYYFGTSGTRELFGGESLRSLPQSWLIGMLLPVCSIGVLPILMEMRRARVKAGALSAFALSAPLFNPLSLLYGLTLSRPAVVLMFAFGSLIVVTLVGWVWDRYGKTTADGSGAKATEEPAAGLIGLRRLGAVNLYIVRQLAGPSGGWAIVGLLGLMLLAFVLPWGSLQSSVERDDWSAPATMTAVALPAYATPMLAMSQLGMMFQHANSPGAAFVLLVLGTGVNLATLAWLARHFGGRSVATWFCSLLIVVVGIAYAINRPLVPPGVEPAGHTHAFDVYTNPVSSIDKASWALLREQTIGDMHIGEQISVGLLAALVALGASMRLLSIDESRLAISTEGDAAAGPNAAHAGLGSYDRIVSPKLVGAVLLAGLVALSVVMCYGYYPSPEETLEEIAIARAETLSAANSGNVEHAAYWLVNWEDWSRRLEVGTFIRTGELRPYQRMQGYLIRKKLEVLEHELEHEPFELEETRKVVRDILATDRRWVAAFRRDQSPGN